jgi:hypothetical protein
VIVGELVQLPRAPVDHDAVTPHATVLVGVGEESVRVPLVG